jgi:subtilisin-like proprotein convertase family protein/subtilisin family serine protease
LAFILGFFLFSTSDPDFMGAGKENQQSEAGEAGNPSEKAVAGNEVEGEKGQGAGGGIPVKTQDQAKIAATSSEGPNPFPKVKKAWSQLPDETKTRLQKYSKSAATLADAGMVRSFRLAMDELYVRDPETGKGKGVVVTPAADLSGLLGQMEKVQAETGLVPELVMYEEGAERNEFTRRVVTRELMLESDSQGVADQAAQSAGLVFRDAPAYAPGKFLYLAESSPEALAAWTQLEEQKIVSSSLLLARQQAKRAMPNDILINQQWHLKYNNQTGARAGTDLNIETIWGYPTAGAGYRGRGIRIGIVDDGVQTSHPDFAGNIDTTNDNDWNDSTPNDPSPGAGDDHGTACAGDAAARGNNSLGVAGSAPEGTLVGMRLIAAATTDQQEADAMNYLPQLIQIKSNSWGPNDTGTILEAPGPLTLAALKNAVETGRASKGTIILWAGGNGLDVNDNSNYDGYANSIYTIAVGAFDSQSRQAYYSESGANLVIVSPSSGLSPALGKTTTDRTGADGYVAGDYESDFGGTSSATPTASGVVALMLEANPNLGWRDVQEILMRSAKKVNVTDTDWKTPVAPANINHNHKFGAGLIDATAAVNMAVGWSNLPAQIIRTNAQTGLSVAIPNTNTTGITREFIIPSQNNIRVEHVTVAVSVTHTARGNLKITLTSPSGTVSRLAEVRSDSNDNYSNWKFMTVRNWGENASGTWRLKISDESSTGNTTGGTLTSATMEVFGSSAAPINPPPSITLISPSDGSVFSPGANINIEATASDLKADGTTGSIESVEFLVNGSAVGTNNAAPYIFAWQPAPGNYTLSVRATDTEGASASTAAISVQVANRRPSMTAGQIAQSGEIFSDQALTLSGLASTDPDGDTVSYAYQWQSSSNGVSFTDGAGLASATLPATSERSGLFWRCRITPSDAGGAGEPFFTAAVAVNRRPPASATVGQVFTYDSDLFLAGTETSFARKAILSEFSQGPSGGTAEWIEFLVLRPSSLRGWKVQDAGGTTVTLAEAAAWDNIPAGTLVVIYNGASKDALLPADDLSVGSDGKMVVSSADPAMCTGSWPSLSNNGDGVILRDALNTILSQVGYGSGTTTPNIGAVSGARSANYRGNTEDGGLLAANWSIETATVARSLKNSRAPGDLFISEYLEGSSFNKAIELYNPSSVSVNLSTASYVLEIYSNGSATASSTITLTGTVAAGATFVIKHSSASASITAQQTSGSLDFNGDDAVVLKKGTSIVDVFGQIGFDPGTAWGSGASSTLNNTLRRKASVLTGDTNGADTFVPSNEWDGFGNDIFSGFGAHTVDGGGGGGGALALVISPSTFAENAGTNAATGTLTLTQSQTTNLVVNLVSSDTSEATVPASVTIPANQTNATFAVVAVDDLDSDGSAGVTITATAGSLSATAAISVTDNEPSLDGVTPGAPNGGDNSVWVGQLRSGALNQPALFRLGSNNPAWLTINPTNGVLSGTPTSSGSFSITLERTNSLGQVATQNFVLSVLDATNDTTPPVITLSGPNPLTILWGGIWLSDGYQVSDNVDGTNVPVTFSNTVNTKVPGTYLVTYTATDSSSNTASTNLTVNVQFAGGGTNRGPDGLPDAVRFAMGADGTNAIDQALRPMANLSGNSLTLNYHARPDESPVELVPVVSTDLADSNSWSTSGITVTTNGTTNANGITLEKRQASVTATNATRKFLRLRATTVP